MRGLKLNRRFNRGTEYSFLILTILLFLFCLRVLGQALVALYHVPFLPPMEEWQSGLLPYPVLLFFQILIIWLYGKVCLDFWHGHGYFFEPKRVLAIPLLWFGASYFIVTSVRLAICVALIGSHKFLGGYIPIVFHFVLASFLILLGNYHQQALRKNRSVTMNRTVPEGGGLASASKGQRAD